MPADSMPLLHAVCNKLQDKCVSVLRLALQGDGRFSISIPAFDTLHLAVYELYILGYLKRSADGFEEWALTDKGRAVADALPSDRVRPGEQPTKHAFSVALDRTTG